MASSWTGDRTPSVAAALALVTLVAWIIPADAAVPRQVTREWQRARERLLQIETAFQTTVEDYHDANWHLERLEARRTAVQASVKANEADIAEHRASVRTVARRLYQGQTMFELGAILGADSTATAAQRIRYLSHAGQLRQETLRQLLSSRDALARDLQELDDARAEAEKQAERLAEVKADVQRLAAEQRGEVERLSRIAQLPDEEHRRRRAAAEAAMAAVAHPHRASGRPALPPSRSSKPRAGAPEEEDRHLAALAAALEQLDKPYRWAASGPDAFDASGLTRYATAQAGIDLPQGARGQFARTPRVARGDLRPGDLVFFGSPIHHVGMYIGQERMVQASASAQAVTIGSINRPDYVGAGRLR